MKNDSLGDRMKRYEAAETERRFMSLLPIYARLDGRSFSRFTRGMERPYDEGMSNCMIDTTKYLVEQTHASVGYTQSDEISLVWANDKIDSEMFFDGKVHKLTSLLAAMATAKFGQLALDIFPERTRKAIPTFDARVFQLPSLTEASNAILWRVNDAVKNSISMAAQTYYSHTELHGKSGKDKHELLHAKGVNWNDYPRFFKEGTFIKRVVRQTFLEPHELPLLMHPKAVEKLLSEGVSRSFYEVMAWPAFKTIANREAVLFTDASPILNEISLSAIESAENDVLSSQTAES